MKLSDGNDMNVMSMFSTFLMFVWGAGIGVTTDQT